MVKHLLLLQRSDFWFPGSPWQLTRNTGGAQPYMQAKQPYTENKKKYFRLIILNK